MYPIFSNVDKMYEYITFLVSYVLQMIYIIYYARTFYLGRKEIKYKGRYSSKNVDFCLETCTPRYFPLSLIDISYRRKSNVNMKRKIGKNKSATHFCTNLIAGMISMQTS